MGETDAATRRRRLKEQVTADLRSRDDVTGFEFRPIDEPGVHVLVDEGVTKLYHVTLETLPDGTEELHWSYLGDIHED